MLNIDSEHSLVFSKSSDSMPITSITVQNEPCFNNEHASAAAGTEPLDSEVNQIGDCPN